MINQLLRIEKPLPCDGRFAGSSQAFSPTDRKDAVLKTKLTVFIQTFACSCK